VLILGSLALVALPLGIAFIAYTYELWIERRYEANLHEAVQEVAAQPNADLDGFGRRYGAAIWVLDRFGRVSADSNLDEVVPEYSFLGGTVERTLAMLGGGDAATTETFVEADRLVGPLELRPEIRRALAGESKFFKRVSPFGQTVVFYFAAPSSTGVIYVAKASHRGVRRLLNMRRELIKVTLYQTLFALLAALVFGRFLVRPLEDLAGAAKLYPARPLGNEKLLSRRDEIGELARSMRALARDLDDKRLAAANLGADISHAFKNPLATIRASTELLESTKELTAEKRRLIASSIDDAASRLQGSIESLMRLLRLETTMFEGKAEYVDYAELLTSLVGEYQADPQWDSMSLSLQTEPGLGSVRILKQPWIELLRNFLDNALIQPSTRREVIIYARRTQDAIVTAVRDFGPGVSPGNRETIFRRFFTHRPPGVTPGTGLGLSIVQAVAAAHGGRIEIESQPGQGAEFRVILPALSKPATPLPQRSH